MVVKQAFTMIELVFVIVILGILSAIALPKFSGVREDAVISKGQAEVSTIRSGISLVKSQRLMEGNTSLPSSLDAAANDTPGAKLFYGGTINVLSSPIYAKATNKDNGWTKKGDTEYYYYVSGVGIRFDYNTTTGSFDCDHTNVTCKSLAE